MSPVSRQGDQSHEMTRLTKVSVKEKLQELSISDILINELGMVAAKVNYGQFPDNLHGFVGSVSLAGIQGGLWNVRGGNYRIPECLLKKSRANLVAASVLSIDSISGINNVTYKFLKNNNDEVTEEFDTVIIATPLTQDKTILKLSIDGQVQKFPGSFQRTLAYIVHGELNPRFGVDVDDNLFFIDEDDVVASVSMLTPVDYDPDKDSTRPSVFKLFSRQELSDDDLAKYFTSIQEKKVIDWLAYPDYSTYTGLDKFRLGKNLFYVNSIEWAASAMEMSALAAKNIANLILDQPVSAADHTNPQEQRKEL
jgi:prenylcysteine oxidase/farnesylcysteine lyase